MTGLFQTAETPVRSGRGKWFVLVALLVVIGAALARFAL